MAIAQKRAQTITATTGGTFNLPNNTVPGTPTVFAGNTATKNQNVYGATGPFTIKFGTGHDNAVYFTGGNQAASSVTGLAGNDSMYLRGGAHGTYTVNMGTGMNTLSLGNAWGSVAYTNTNAAASTYDTLDLSNVSSTFTNLSLLATTGAVATASGTIADAHSFRALKLGSGAAGTVVLNNLDDTITFGNGTAAVTGGTGDDVYAFKNFTGAVNVAQSITDAAGTNTIDLSATTSNVSVNFTSATGGAAYISGTGAGAGHTETVTFSGTTGIANIIGGAGNDTYTFGNTAGVHSVNGGTGSNTLVYNGSQGVTLDIRDHELANAAATTDITFHGISTYKVLGGGNNTIIGDGSTGNSFYLGNGTNYVDTLGGASTIHSDMGGNTTVYVGTGYGATTVTNTASSGMLTIDASGLTTHALGTVTLGVGNGTAYIDNTLGDTVTWGAGSKVTGFIGNDLVTTINAVGNLNFRITGGALADTITSSGSGNSVINTGNGNDVVTLSNAAGDNTVIFGSGTVTLTAGANNGNNSIFAGSGTGTETLGTGANIIDFSNGGTHTLSVGSGANVLQGFSANNNWAVTVTDTMNNAAGTLDLSNYSSTDVTWDDQQNVSGGTNFVNDLKLTLDASHTILIHGYFDGSATTATASAAGTGAIQTLHFGDMDLNFAAVKALSTTSAFL
jgi:hypothetical protein